MNKTPIQIWEGKGFKKMPGLPFYREFQPSGPNFLDGIAAWHVWIVGITGCDTVDMTCDNQHGDNPIEFMRGILGFVDLAVKQKLLPNEPQVLVMENDRIRVTPKRLEEKAIAPTETPRYLVGAQ